MSDRPLLVLVHGTRFTARAWDGYADQLPEADVVAVDLPGHGNRVGQSYTTEAALASVNEAMDSIDDSRPVVLAGHSLGGYVATTYAEQHPDRLHGLVLIGAMADPSRHRILRHLYSDTACLIPVVGADRMARFANRVMLWMGLEEKALPDASGYAVAPDAWTAVIDESGAHQLEDVTCPVYLVAGQYDQLRIDMREYAEACAEARVYVVPKASHLVPLTHLDEVAEVFRVALREAVRQRA